MLAPSRPNPDRFSEDLSTDRGFENDFEVASESNRFGDLRAAFGISESSLRRYDRAEIRAFVRSVAQDIERFEQRLESHLLCHPPETVEISPSKPSPLIPLLIDLTTSLKEIAMRTGILDTVGPRELPKQIDRSYASAHLQRRLTASST